MNRCKAVIFAAAICIAGIAACPSPASAQTFQNYRCADGTQFIVGFFDRDSRAHLQVDGRELALGKRLALSGSHYSGSGVSLKFAKAGTTLKLAERPATACEVS